MRLLLSLILIASIASACLPGALADESGPGFSFILQSNENLEISGAARIKGDTYSRGNTQVFGSAAIDGRGYASGSVSFDSPDLPYTGMVYSNAGVQEFPNIDFNHYKSLAQSTGKVFTNNLHLTKANPMAGVIFVEGNLKVSGGIHRISAFVTGDIKVSGQSNLSSNTDGHLLAAAGPIEISGAPAIDGVVYSRDASITITGGPSLKGAVAAKRDLKVSGNISAQDTIAPAGPVLDQPPNFSATSTTEISGRAEAHSQLELIEGAVVLGSAVVDAVGNFSLNLNLAEGSHTIIAVAQDSAGNVSEPSAPVNTTVDLTPPYVTLAAPSLLEPLKGTPTLEASATDNFEVEKVQFFLDDEPIGTDTSYPYQTPLDTTVYTNGTHTLKLVAYDGAGNSGQSETEVQIANNVVTPFGGEITSPDGLVTLNFAPGSVSEPVEIVYSSISSQALTGFSSAGPFFDLSARTLGGQDVSWFFQPFTVSVNSISDAPNQSLYFLNSQTGSWEMIKPSTVFQGRLTAQLDHFTLFGVLSDTQSPSTSASPSTEAAPSGWHLTDTAVTLAATDTGSGVERISYQFDFTSPLWQTYTAPIAVPEGEHTLYFYGEDKAGNGEYVKSIELKIDTSAPVAEFNSPAPGELLRAERLVEVSASDTVSGVGAVAFYVNDSLLAQAFESPFNFQLNTGVFSDGNNEAIAVTRDLAGKATTVSLEFYIDNTPPVVTAVFPAGDDTATPDGAVSVLFSEEINLLTLDNGSFYLSTAEGQVVPAVANYDSLLKTAILTPLQPLTEGATYMVSLSSAIADLAGNNFINTNWVFTVSDLTSPNTIISGPADGAVIGASQLISGIATDNIGVAAVDLAITRSSDGAYFDGTGFVPTPTRLAAELEAGETTRAFSYLLNLPPDGSITYIIRARAQDTAEQYDVDAAEITVAFDNAGPQAQSFDIFGGAAETLSLNVSVDSSVSDVAFMRLAESPEALGEAVWQPYNQSLDYEFADQEATKTILAQFKDENGNIGAVSSDTIFYSPQLGRENFYTTFNKQIGDHDLAVNLVSGNLSLSNLDLQVTALGISDKIYRTYNSLSRRTGAPAPGWQLNTDAEITVGPGGSAQYLDPDGSRHSFEALADGAYATPPGVNLALTKTTTFTLTSADSSFTFLGQGVARLVRTAQEGLNPTAFSRNASGTVTAVNYPYDGASTFAYSGNKLVSITDPLSRQVIYGYNQAAELTSFTSVGGPQLTYGHSSGRLTSIADGDGETVIGYDEKGRVKEIIDPRPGETTPIVISFNYQRGKTFVTEPENGATTYHYNQGGNPVKIIDPTGAEQTFTWSENRLSAVATSDTAVSYAYDTRGNVTDIFSTIDDETTAHVSAFYRDGKLVGFTDADEGTTSITRGPVVGGGRSETYTDSRGFISSLVFDKYNNLAQKTDWQNPGDTSGSPKRVLNLSYSQNGGNLRQVAAPSGGVTSFGYQATDKSWQVVNPRGFRTSVWVDDGAKSLGGGARITKTKNYLSEETNFSYSQSGRLATITNPRGGRAGFTYDQSGRLSQAVNPLGQSAGYLYSAQGRVKQVNTPTGVALFNYDSGGRIVGTGYTKNGSTLAYAFKYRPGTSRLETVQSGGAAHNFTYNRVGWVTKATDAFGFSQTYKYTKGGKLTAIKLAGEATIALSHRHNLLTGLIDPLGGTKLGYDAARNLTWLERPNNTKTIINYDKAGRQKEQVTALDGGTMTVAYEYDKSQNVTVEAVGLDLNTYAYDGLSRLTSWAGEHGTVDYGYDGGGNLIKKGDATYTYNAANQLTSDGTNTYSYDDSGNLTADGRNTFTWDGAGRLTGFTSGQGTVEYGYDFAGRRTSKILADGTERKYHYLGDQLVAESDQNGVIATYAYTDKGKLHSTTRAGQTYYYHLSAKDDVLGLSNASGALVAKYTYDPWGKVLTSAGDPASQPFRARGAYHDSESGMSYINNRYYQPQVSRFISPGNGAMAGFGDYTYFANNPASIDPVGFSSECEAICGVSGHMSVFSGETVNQSFANNIGRILPADVSVAQGGDSLRGRFGDGGGGSGMHSWQSGVGASLSAGAGAASVGPTDRPPLLLQPGPGLQPFGNGPQISGAGITGSGQNPPRGVFGDDRLTLFNASPTNPGAGGYCRAGGPGAPGAYSSDFFEGVVWGPHNSWPKYDIYSLSAGAGAGYVAFNHQYTGWGHTVAMSGPGDFSYGGSWGGPPKPPVEKWDVLFDSPRRHKIVVSPSSWTVSYPWAMWLWYEGYVVYPTGPILPPDDDHPGDHDLHPGNESGDGGDPVSTSSGNFSYDHQDLKFAGKGESLEFTRTYNSMDLRGSAIDNERVGPMGRGWTHNYSESLRFSERDTTITVVYGTGRRIKFSATDYTNYRPKVGVREKLVKNSNGSYTLTFSDQRKRNYDSFGRLLSKTDKFGNTTALSYGANGLLSGVTDAGGRTLTFTYDGFKRLTKAVDSAGRSAVYDYDSRGNLKKFTDARGKITNYAYDANNQLTEIKEAGAEKPILKNVYGDHVSYGPVGQNLVESPGLIYEGSSGGGSTNDGNVKHIALVLDPGAGDHGDDELDSMGYRAHPGSEGFMGDRYLVGKVVKQYDAHGNQWNYSYDTAGRKTTMTNNKGDTIVHEYDADYRLVKSTDPLAGATNYLFGLLNQPLRTTDALGRSTIFGYDANGNTTETIGPDGHRAQARYDQYNNTVWAKDAAGKETNYGYDGTGKFLRSVTDPIGTTLFDYFSDGQLKTTTDSLGHRTDFAYNAFGNLTKVTDSLNSSITMQYDQAGNMTAATDANGAKSEYAYDQTGNILSIKDPLAALYQTERHQVDFTYDGRGNLTSYIDANSNSTRFNYDNENSLTSVIEEDNAMTTFGYDPNYYLAWVKDAEGHTTHYEHDQNNRLKSVTDATSRTVEYRYDAAGNLTNVIYPNGNENLYKYDSNDRMSGVSYSSNETSYVVEYNAVDVPTSVQSSLGRIWLFAYDQGDRLATTTEPINPSLGDFTISRSYDKEDNLTELKASVDSTVGYSYSSRYDLISIDLPGADTTEISFAYDLIGYRTSNILPGSTSTVSFDSAGRVTTVSIDTALSSDMLTYTHDANGNVLNETRFGDNSGRRTYGYDKLNRLVSWYDLLADTTTTYSYDKAGNLLEVKDGDTVTKTFTYNPANQISSPGYLYNDNGNMIRGTGDGGRGTQYQYDSENRLVKVADSETSETMVSYTYDFMGRRISSTTSDTTTYFHYDGWNVVAESNENGEIAANYYYDTNGQVQAMKRNGQLFYYQFNAHGDVVSLTDSFGTIVNTYSYDPWGNHLSSSETVANPYRYAGYRYDSYTGLYYLRTRYYSSSDYRFITKDKEPQSLELRAPQTFNLYAYCVGDPVNYIDPDGDVAQMVGPAIGQLEPVVRPVVGPIVRWIIGPAIGIGIEYVYRPGRRALEGIWGAGVKLKNYIFAKGKNKTGTQKKRTEQLKRPSKKFRGRPDHIRRGRRDPGAQPPGIRK